MINIEITHGLPGSGKTTYLKNRKEELTPKFRPKNSTYIDCDMLMRKAKNDDRSNLSIEDKFKKFLVTEIEYFNDLTFNDKKDYYLLIDILSTTNNDLITLINILKETISKPFNITIDWWKEDRDSYIWNDENRRNENSINSIKSLPFEKPNKELIFNETNIKVELNSHEVQRKSNEMHLAHKYKLCGDKGIIESDSWSLGGTYGNCWGESYRVYASEPCNFDAFDNVIEKLNPNTSFLQYKKIRDKCVKTEDWSEGDYYGGCVNYCKYVCDIIELIKLMQEMNLIEME